VVLWCGDWAPVSDATKIRAPNSAWRTDNRKSSSLPPRGASSFFVLVYDRSSALKTERLSSYTGSFESRELEGARSLTASVTSAIGVEPRSFVLATFHRQANVDNAASLARIIELLNHLVEQEGFTIVLPLHPRTRNRIDQFGLRSRFSALMSHPHFIVTAPNAKQLFVFSSRGMARQGEDAVDGGWRQERWRNIETSCRLEQNYLINVRIAAVSRAEQMKFVHVIRNPFDNIFTCLCALELFNLACTARKCKVRSSGNHNFPLSTNT
jgi:hypothetical protein